MVSKKEINTIIDKILEDNLEVTIKCRKPSYSLNSLNNYVKHAFNEFNKKYGFGNEDGKEHCLSVLKNGEMLNENTGTEYSVKPKYDDGAKMLLEKIASDLTKPLDDSEWYDHELHVHFKEELIKRLNETNDGIYHIHSHPSNYDITLPTYLSDADCNNTFLNSVHYRTATLYNTVKCQMAVAKNGTSMVLINHNPVGTKLGFSEDKFRTAVSHLQRTMRDYDKSMRDKIKGMQNDLIEKEIKKIPKSVTSDQRDDLEKQIGENVRKTVYKQIMDENKNNFPKLSDDVVSEFEELGFELKFDFSDVILE